MGLRASANQPFGEEPIVRRVDRRNLVGSQYEWQTGIAVEIVPLDDHLCPREVNGSVAVVGRRDVLAPCDRSALGEERDDIVP